MSTDAVRKSCTRCYGSGVVLVGGPSGVGDEGAGSLTANTPSASQERCLRCGGTGIQPKEQPTPPAQPPEFHDGRGAGQIGSEMWAATDDIAPGLDLAKIAAGFVWFEPKSQGVDLCLGGISMRVADETHGKKLAHAVLRRVLSRLEAPAQGETPSCEQFRPIPTDPDRCRACLRLEVEHARHWPPKAVCQCRTHRYDNKYKDYDPDVTCLGCGLPLPLPAPQPKPRHWRDGDPCNHPGCLSHRSHPCEGCGRIGGITGAQPEPPRSEPEHQTWVFDCPSCKAGLNLHTEDGAIEIVVPSPAPPTAASPNKLAAFIASIDEQDEWGGDGLPFARFLADALLVHYNIREK